MALFQFIKKEKKIKEDLFNIPCDYEGYDFTFKDDQTDPLAYIEITKLLTNNQFDLTTMQEYQSFKEYMNTDTYFTFYDHWMNELRKNKYVIHLDEEMNMTELTHAVNELLLAINSNIHIDENQIADNYKRELNKYTIDGKDITNEIKYDILEANIIEEELQKNGYELICLFNGYDNDDKTIIPIEQISKFKELEKRI